MLLEVRDLCAGYDKVEIVHGMSFSADAGEFVCLIGANGCGKTTTLKCMLGLLEPFSGQVLVNGADTTAMSEKQRARHFAYIPQAHTPPFPFSVADVVILGRTSYINALSRVSDEDRCIAFGAMQLLGIEDLADRVYTALSGGQQQLVLIARALAQQPDVLVMHEGSLLAQGTPAEVMDDACLRTIYDTQARIVEVEIAPGLTTKVCVPIYEEKLEELVK